MSAMSRLHQEVGVDGVGKCSVPMWMNGMDAGFCDKPAYGNRPDGETLTRWDGEQYRADGRYAGYVPGLACAAHGGPKNRPATPTADAEGREA
jgi:hypothetical protein